MPIVRLRDVRLDGRNGRPSHLRAGYEYLLLRRRPRRQRRRRGGVRECWYDDCSDDDDDDDGDGDDDGDDKCDIETSNDLNSSPSGTTNHGAGKLVLFESLQISARTASRRTAARRIRPPRGHRLVGRRTLLLPERLRVHGEVGGAPGYIFYTITRDSAVAALPVECGSTASSTPARDYQVRPQATARFFERLRLRP